MGKSPTEISQSAVIAYRKGKKGLEVLLVTSRDTRRWVLPKGGVEPGLSPAQSAAKEAWEEAGVEGKVAKAAVGSYRYIKPDLPDTPACTVEVFPMEVTEVLSEWPEKRERRREWLSPQAAAKRVDEKKLKKILRDFGQES